MLSQILPLIGVLVGSFATYLATEAAERRRWQRGQTARWDETRMRVYAEYGNAVKRCFYLGVRVATSRGFSFAGEALSADEGIPRLGAAEEERAVRWEPVLLLGDAETMTAARAWHEAVWRIGDFARGTRDGLDEWEQVLHESGIARDRFYATARRDLEVSSHPPTTPRREGRP